MGGSVDEEVSQVSASAPAKAMWGQPPSAVQPSKAQLASVARAPSRATLHARIQLPRVSALVQAQGPDVLLSGFLDAKHDGPGRPLPRNCSEYPHLLTKGETGG